MKKVWEKPIIKVLELQGTNDIPMTNSVLDMYPGRIKCKYCNLVFENGELYNLHLTRAVISGGYIAGYECDSAPNNDNRIDDGAILMTS